MKSNHDNPLGLHIGETVEVKRKCYVDYEKNEKRLFFYAPPNSTAKVVGTVKRALGTYMPGTVHWEYEGRADPYLKVSKYVWLYECKTTIGSKIFLVHPDDIGVGSDNLLDLVVDWRAAEVHYSAILLGIRTGDEHEAHEAMGESLRKLRIVTDCIHGSEDD